MTIQEVKQNWIKEINEVLSRFGATVKENSIVKVYDVSSERGMSRKLWLCGECTDNKTRYYYMYITKKNVLKKYNGSFYANTKSDFETDIKDYKSLGIVS